MQAKPKLEHSTAASSIAPDGQLSASYFAVKPGTAARMLDCGVTKVYELIKRGELRTVPFETDKRIPIEEVRRVASEGTGAR